MRNIKMEQQNNPQLQKQLDEIDNLFNNISNNVGADLSKIKEHFKDIERKINKTLDLHSSLEKIKTDINEINETITRIQQRDNFNIMNVDDTTLNDDFLHIVDGINSLQYVNKTLKDALNVIY